MYNLSIAHIDCNMSTVADQVAWLGVCVGNFGSPVLLLVGCSRKAVAELCIDTLRETRTVSTVCKACAAPYIRVSNKLQCIIYDRRARTTG